MLFLSCKSVDRSDRQSIDKEDLPFRQEFKTQSSLKEDKAENTGPAKSVTFEHLLSRFLKVDA